LSPVLVFWRKPELTFICRLAYINMTKLKFSIRHLPLAVALTVALFSASLAWRAAATEETVASPGEIVPESDNLRDASGHIADIPVVPLADAVTTADGIARTLSILGTNIYPNSSQRFSWAATELFEGVPVSTPVLVVNGKFAGPTLCLTAAVHGDELNGIEMVRRVMHDLNSEKLSGAVLGVPIVNLQGFRRGSRYLPDRRDLNRFFPGNPNGSAASRIAYSFFTGIIQHCDALIDLHTGSFERANLPQLRADLRDPDVVTLTQGFGATVILHSEPAEGTLRFAATAAGIPAVTLEAGGPSELELKEVKHGVKGIETLLNTLGMVKKIRLWGEAEPVYYRSTWVRANRGGILLADVTLGSTVRQGDLLGTITDPMNNASTKLYSPHSGRIIGMARNQVVMPGFAVFHVGIQTDEASVDISGIDVADFPSDSDNDAYVDGMSE
jgi:predicted deacylase